MFSEHDFNLQPQQVLVIGPNQTFLNYFRGLLPSLGVNGIAQRTFQDWAWERLSRRGPARAAPVFQDAVADSLDDPKGKAEDRQRLWQSARLRGSLRYGEMIGRHARHLADHPVLPATAFTTEVTHDGVAQTYALGPEAVRALWNATPADHVLMDRRDQLLDASEHVNAWFEAEFGRPDTPEDAADDERRLQQVFGPQWPQR